MKTRRALVPDREPRSRQGHGWGKSITYGRLSPPLSAFNHTLCEQNIKTCPFVCQRRFDVDLRAGVMYERVGKPATSGQRLRRLATDLVTLKSFLAINFCEVFLRRSVVVYCEDNSLFCLQSTTLLQICWSSLRTLFYSL